MRTAVCDELYAHKCRARGCSVYRSATLAAQSRTQPSVSLSSAETEQHALTTRIAHGMATEHLMSDLDYSVNLVNHVDNQAAKAQKHPKRALGWRKHIMLKNIFVQNRVEKVHTDLMYIRTRVEQCRYVVEKPWIMIRIWCAQARQCDAGHENLEN